MAVLTLVVATIDFGVGAQTSVSLFYLLPLAILTWLVGRRWGIVFSVTLAIWAILLQAMERVVGIPDIWNAGMWCGVCVCFCVLLDQVRTHDGGLKMVNSMRRVVIGTALIACAIAGAGLIVQQRLLARQGIRFTRQTDVPQLSPQPSSEPMTGARATRVMSQFRARMSATRNASRPLLLGSRDPNGPSCVSPVLAGQVRDQLPPNSGDFDGGPGMRMGMLYLYDRRFVRNSREDYLWHQTRLRTYLENQVAMNQPAQAMVQQIATDAAHLAAAAQQWTSFPAELTAIDHVYINDWPGFCLTNLTRAINARDLPSTQRWSSEFAAALFALEDLHRWLEFLTENQLAALDFQRESALLFQDEGMKIREYNLTVNIGDFPAGVLGVNGMSNYYEIERQAETLYATLSAEAGSAIYSESPALETIWMPPGVRTPYAVFAQELSGANREHWRRAARTPYERSYLVNMLHRASAAGTLESLRTVLRRFNTIHSDATLQQLMDVMMYRGHSFGAMEWGDRYQTSLVNATNDLTGTDIEAFHRASRLANDLYRRGTYGISNTLREALETQKVDCIRATDMAGAIYRNGGRARFGYVWWSGGTSSHSLTAYLGRDGDKPVTRILDPLDVRPEPELWPDAYFQGHAWPPNIAQEAPPYCVELYIRGLDNYVWAEGYVIRGPNAGTLVKTPIPYQPVRVEKSRTQVYAGPFPQ